MIRLHGIVFVFDAALRRISPSRGTWSIKLLRSVVASCLINPGMEAQAVLMILLPHEVYLTSSLREKREWHLYL